MENIGDLFCEIRNCVGRENCWGKRNEICLNPVALPCGQRPEVMIVTEQKKVQKSEIPKEWNPTKELLDFITEAKKGNRKKGIILRIDKLFNGRFLEDFDTDERVFHKFYWTHFIKCPGNLRNRNFDLSSRMDKDICAETFLPKEIQVFRPKVIACMGKHASSWILKKSGYPDDWMEMLWREVEWVVKENKQIPGRAIETKDYKHKAKIIVLPHPSGKNPLYTFLNEKLRPLVTTMLP